MKTVLLTDWLVERCSWSPGHKKWCIKISFCWRKRRTYFRDVVVKRTMETQQLNHFVLESSQGACKPDRINKIPPVHSESFAIGHTWPYFHGKAANHLTDPARLCRGSFPVGNSMEPPLEAQFSVFISAPFFLPQHMQAESRQGNLGTTAIEQRQSNIVHISSPQYPNLYSTQFLSRRQMFVLSIYLL